MSLLWISVFNLALTVGASYVIIKGKLSGLADVACPENIKILKILSAPPTGCNCKFEPFRDRPETGTLTVEEVYKDRDQFAGLVREVAAPDVGRMGIEILSFTIKDVYDDVQYLTSLGKSQTAVVKRDADIGIAQANRCKSLPADTSYIAAVVEYQVQSNSAANLNNYVNLIKDASAQNADIVVFPEMTLTRGNSVAVPIHGLLKEYPIPALQPELYDEILVSISAAARQSEIYVVINVQEILNCTDSNANGENCPEQRGYRFNTNVVFDRTGAVISRYRKINLFGEFTRTPALTPDLGVFETDFGVTFGHYICFDLMFQVPAVQVVEKMNITNIIFPTMWFSEMPYLTAVQIQQSYAYTMNVNFLAAGANNPKVGSAGSGIYSGKAGALVSIMPGLPTTRLLVATVPKLPGQVTGNIRGPIYDDLNQDNLKLNTDHMLESQKTRLLTNETRDFSLTDKDVVCHFRVRMSERNGDTAPFYRAFIQDGIHVYAKRNVGDVACAVVACKTDDPKSCVYRLSNKEDNVNIEELEIQMTSYKKHYNSTLKCNDIIYFPVSLRNNKFPLDPKNITYIVRNVEDDFETTNELGSDRLHIRYRINSPQNDLISFGIWGRIYLRDGEVTRNGSKEDIRQYIEVENIIYSHDKGREQIPL